MKFLSFLCFVFLLSSFLPVPAHAADLYANDVTDESYYVTNADHILGAPDDSRADFSQEADLTIDMGEGEAGLGDLIVYYRLVDYGAYYEITLLDADQNALQVSEDYVPNLTGSFTIAYDGETPYRYVKIENIYDYVYCLQAMKANEKTPMKIVRKDSVLELEIVPALKADQ